MPIQFHKLKVATVRYVSAAAVQIGFKIPEKKREIFQFDSGQYLTISLLIDGKKVRRAYSICSAIQESIISILVKRVEQGLVSNYLNDQVKVGDSFEVLPPNGHFKLVVSEEQQNQYYFFGAGSGITPLASMITSVLEKEANSHCYLLYGNRAEEQIIFYKKLERLQLVYKDRFVLTHILSRPSSTQPSGWKSIFQSPKSTWQGQTGRVDKQSISNFFQATNQKNKNSSGYFICGPGAMIEATYQSLLDLQIDKELIHREYFSAPIADTAEIATDSTPQIEATVKVILEGKEIVLQINDDRNIVQALLDKDIEPPYSCLSGTCSTCMAKLEKGKVRMDVSIGLEEDEKADGFILTCQSHPTTEQATINFDKALNS